MLSILNLNVFLPCVMFLKYLFIHGYTLTLQLALLKAALQLTTQELRNRKQLVL